MLEHYRRHCWQLTVDVVNVVRMWVDLKSLEPFSMQEAVEVEITITDFA